jgi:hypothetical protein
MVDPLPNTPNSFGIYALSHPVDIRPDTYRPPYVPLEGSGLGAGITFYNLNGNTSETAQQMIPVDGKCHFSKGGKVEFALEYVKNTYSGVIQSIVIGSAHNNLQVYACAIGDVDLPDEFKTGTGYYLLEHTKNGTILHKNPSGGNVVNANLKTKEFAMTAGGGSYSNTVTYFGGLILNDTVFKVAKASASGATHTVTLTYVPNWKNSTNQKSMNIPFTAREGMTVNTTVQPVLVARPDQNRLEVFVTLSTGDHGGETGANIQKAVVDISDVNNLTYTITDLGVIPYAISNYGTTVAQYMTGLYHEGKYYLPYYYIVDEGGILKTPTNSGYQEGAVLSADLKTMHGIINFRHTNAIVNAPVVADEVLQCQVNTATSPFVHLTRVVSGTNLDTPIMKGANDVLRIIYRYKLA